MHFDFIRYMGFIHLLISAEETKAQTLDALKEAKIDLEQVVKSVKTAQFQMAKLEEVRR